jgi:hypothetical protein
VRVQLVGPSSLSASFAPHGGTGSRSVERSEISLRFTAVSLQRSVARTLVRRASMLRGSVHDDRRRARLRAAERFVRRRPSADDRGGALLGLHVLPDALERCWDVDVPCRASADPRQRV